MNAIPIEECANPAEVLKIGDTFRLVPIAAVLILGLSCVPVGCTPAPAKAPASTPLPVMVSYPVERDVTDYADFTARTAAVDSVEMRARVWGYLEKVNFKEGDLVKKNDVLFEIDPRVYRAALDQAKAEVERQKSQLDLDEIELRRSTALLRRNAVSREEFDQAHARRGVTRAGLAAAEALAEQAALDLGYTKVTAPVSGRVSRYVVTVGNLIQSGNQGGGTLLTTIVSVDPMYAYFDVDERTACAFGSSSAKARAIRRAPVGTRCRSGWPTRRATLTRE
jgi:RND family efflux transporter MFP subunit